MNHNKAHNHETHLSRLHFSESHMINLSMKMNAIHILDFKLKKKMDNNAKRIPW